MHIVHRFIARTRQRGSSDLTVTLLLTAAGAAMVAMTLPSLFKSSDTASRTFDHQVQILERGAGTTPSTAGTVPPVFDMGTPGQIQAPTGQSAITQAQGAISQTNASLVKGQ